MFIGILIRGVKHVELRILFLILVTDLPPSIALGMEPGERTVAWPSVLDKNLRGGDSHFTPKTWNWVCQQVCLSSKSGENHPQKTIGCQLSRNILEQPPRPKQEPIAPRPVAGTADRER